MTVKIDGTNTVSNPGFTGADTATGLQCGTGELKLVTAGTTRATIDYYGNVGIGTTSPLDYDTTSNNLVVGEAGSGDRGITVASGTSHRGTLMFADATSGLGEYAGYVQYNHNGDYLAIAANNSEAVRINSSGNVGIGTSSPAVELDVNGEIRASTGILFGTDTAAANTLDDYEEGTFTAIVSSTGNVNGSLATGSGVYTKIGRVVRITAKILSNNTQTSGHSGNVIIRGLPFASGSNTLEQIAAPITHNGVYGKFVMSLDFPGTTPYLTVHDTAEQADYTALFPNNANIRYYFSLTYTVY